MKNLLFSVKPLPEDNPISNIFKNLTTLTYRISFDPPNRITIHYVDETMIDSIEYFIKKFYTIEHMEILEHSEPVGGLSTTLQDEFCYTTIASPNTELGKALKSLFHHIDRSLEGGASEKDIGKDCWSFKNYMSMKYLPREVIPFALGDIIDCDYGHNFSNELHGIHNVIICHQEQDGSVYVVPIIKKRYLSCKDTYVECRLGRDITPQHEKCQEGIVWISRGSYVNSSRFIRLVGRANSSFFTKIKEYL